MVWDSKVRGLMYKSTGGEKKFKNNKGNIIIEQFEFHILS